MGMAVLAPGRVVGLVMLPFVLFELGAGIATETSSERSVAWGLRIQALGAFAYFALFVLVVALPFHRSRATWIVGSIALLGLVASGIVAWDRRRLSRGLSPRGTDPLRAGERIASGTQGRSSWARLVDALAVVGGTPIVMGSIALTFVIAGAAVIFLRGAEPQPTIVIGLVFFGACALIAVAQGLSRWETYVASSRVRPLRELLELVSFFAFGGSLAAVGWQMLESHEGSRIKAWFLLVVGVLMTVGGSLYVARSRLGIVQEGYELVREGLLERTRRGWFLYRWDHVFSLALGEFKGMPALFVSLGADLVIEPIDDGSRFLLHGRTADMVNIAGKRNSIGYLDHQLTAIPGVV
ncbi:MAG TPA: hypothetical protein VF103_00125, partial [Polyangiaceae bacterium]